MTDPTQKLERVLVSGGYGVFWKCSDGSHRALNDADVAEINTRLTSASEPYAYAVKKPSGKDTLYLAEDLQQATEDAEGYSRFHGMSIEPKPLFDRTALTSTSEPVGLPHGLKDTLAILAFEELHRLQSVHAIRRKSVDAILRAIFTLERLSTTAQPAQVPTDTKPMVQLLRELGYTVIPPDNGPVEIPMLIADPTPQVPSREALGDIDLVCRYAMDAQRFMPASEYGRGMDHSVSDAIQRLKALIKPMQEKG